MMPQIYELFKGYAIQIGLLLVVFPTIVIHFIFTSEVHQFLLSHPLSIFQSFVDVSGHFQSFLPFSLSPLEFIIVIFILIAF